MPSYDLDMQELPLFHELTPAEIERFLLSTEAQVKRYGKGARILEAYQPNAQIGVMVEGAAQVVAEDRFGNETGGHTLHRGDMMGSSSAILPQVRCNTSVEALSNVLVLVGSVSFPFGGGAAAGAHSRHRDEKSLGGLLPEKCPDDAED